MDVLEAANQVYESFIDFNAEGNESNKTEVLGGRLVVLRRGVDR